MPDLYHATDVDEAIELLTEALQLRPDYTDAHYQLGKIFNERGENAKASEHLEAASRADKTKDYVCYQLSIAYRRASRKSDADEALKTYQGLKASNRQLPSPMGNTTNAPNQ